MTWKTRTDKGSRQASLPVSTLDRWVNIDCSGYKPSLSHNHTRQGTKTWTNPETWENTISWDGNGKQFRHQCGHVRITETAQPGRIVGDGIALSSSTTQGLAYNVPWHGEKSFMLHGSYLPKAIPSSLMAPAQLDWRAAYERLLDDASGLLPDDVSIGTNIAEFAQLKGLFKKPARQITRILQYVRRHPNRKIRRWRYLTDKKGNCIPWTLSYEEVKLSSFKWSLKDLSATYLGVQFGALPLADDIGNWAAKFWQVRMHLAWWKRLYRGEQTWVRAATPSVLSPSQDDHLGSGSESCIVGTCTYDVNSHISAETHGILHARIQAVPKQGASLANALLSQVLGLNVPLQLAWELVPFSFVIDWFFPVGDLISRVEPRRAIGGLCRDLRILETWHTVVHQVESRIEAENIALSTKWGGSDDYRARFGIDFTASGSGSFRSKKYRSYSRSLGMPALNFSPVAKSRFGLKQALISTALIVQRAVR